MARTAIYKLWIDIPNMPDSEKDYDAYNKAWEEWHNSVTAAFKQIPGFQEYDFEDSYE